MTLANKITLSRILLIPPFVIALLSTHPWWTLGLFLFLVLTDALDGFLARRLNQKTTLGAFLDPVADKLLLGAAFLVLAVQGRVPTWVFVVVFSRDLLILLGWNLIYILTRVSTVEPRWLGKASTTVQMATVVVHLMPGLEPVRFAATALMTLVTALSTVDYVWLGGRKLNQLG